MPKINFLRPVVIQEHVFLNQKTDPIFNWNVVMAVNAIVDDYVYALTLSKNMLKVLYRLITTGDYTPKISIIENFDKSRVSYDESDDGLYGFIRYHFSDDWQKYTDEDDEFYNNTILIFMSTYIDLQEYVFDDSDRDKYEYYEASEVDCDISNEGSYFISYFEGLYYAISLSDFRDGVVGVSNTLHGAVAKLEKYLSDTFNLPECIYFDCDVKEGNVWISKKEQ